MPWSSRNGSDGLPVPWAVTAEVTPQLQTQISSSQSQGPEGYNPHPEMSLALPHGLAIWDRTAKVRASMWAQLRLWQGSPQQQGPGDGSAEALGRDFSGAGDACHQTVTNLRNHVKVGGLTPPEHHSTVPPARTELSQRGRAVGLSGAPWREQFACPGSPGHPAAASFILQARQGVEEHRAPSREQSKLQRAVPCSGQCRTVGSAV